jgi:S1-C subfamily serine protease
MGASYIGVRGDRRTDRAVVTYVHNESPAARAGIEVGDVITRFAGQRVQSFSDLVNIVQLRQPGEQVQVELRRRNRTLTKDLRVGKRDADKAVQRVSS